MQFGGVDQRKIFVYAEEFLPKLGYKEKDTPYESNGAWIQKPAEADGDTKMSSSSNAKIDLLDTAKNVKKK